jgi:hypothetical protein
VFVSIGSNLPLGVTTTTLTNHFPYTDTPGNSNEKSTAGGDQVWFPSKGGCCEFFGFHTLMQ